MLVARGGDPTPQRIEDLVREPLSGLNWPDVLVAVRELFSALSAVQIVGPANVAQAAVPVKDAVMQRRDPTEADERFVALARKVLRSEK